MIVLESLESRTLFAGVTIITHGFEDTTTGWVSTMADAIANRAGGKSAVAIYTLDVGLDSRGDLAVLDFDHQSNTATVTTASSGQTIIKLNWSTVSDGTYSTVQVGDVAAAWLMATPAGLPPLDQMPIDLIGHHGAINSVCFSPQGDRIVTGSDDKTAKVWDATTGQEVLTLKGHTGRVYSVCFSPDGTLIVTGSRDGTARIWISENLTLNS